MLATAKCDDSVEFRRRIAGIEAKLQHDYVKAHEHELVAVKQSANERVKAARTIQAEVSSE